MLCTISKTDCIARTEQPVSPASSSRLGCKCSRLQGVIGRELAVLRSGAASSEVLKREVLALSRDLLAERTKVRALSEELENPLNVHRWIFSLPQHAYPAEELGVLLHAAASTHTL